MQEVCKEIRGKLGEESAGGNDHGLFFPEQGKWLDPGHTLDYYDLKTGVSGLLFFLFWLDLRKKIKWLFFFFFFFFFVFLKFFFRI